MAVLRNCESVPTARGNPNYTDNHSLSRRSDVISDLITIMMGEKNIEHKDDTVCFLGLVYVYQDLTSENERRWWTGTLQAVNA